MRTCIGTMLLLMGLMPAPAYAQLRYGGDLALRHGYVWRGLLVHTGPVVQPDVFLAYGGRPLLLTTGVWTTIEAYTPGGSGEAGYGQHWFPQTEAWAELASRRKPLLASVGWVGYFNDAGDAAGGARGREDTNEVYGKLQLVASRFNPHVSVWQSLEAPWSRYWEGALTWRVPGWNYVLAPIGSLFLKAEIGHHAGESQDSLAEPTPRASSFTGITHLDFSAATSLLIWPVRRPNFTMHLEVHLTRMAEGRGLLRAAGEDRSRWRLWVGLILSRQGMRCRPGRELCRE